MSDDSNGGSEAAVNNPEKIYNPRGFSGAMLHMGVAEQGKVHAVEGDHATALLYYRRAMHMTVQNGDEEWFFRHYLECAIESLELLESYQEVLDYCDKEIELYAANPPEDLLSVLDLAHIHQRKGVILCKQGDIELAKEPLREAVRLVQGVRQRIPLAERLLRWIDSGFRVDAARLLAEQKREKYFTVRPENIEPERAVKLPLEMLGDPIDSWHAIEREIRNAR